MCRRTYTSSRAGQQGPTRTLTAAPKRSLKQLLDAFNYYTQVNITNKKTKKSMFCWKTFKDVQYTIDGSAFYRYNQRLVTDKSE